METVQISEDKLIYTQKQYHETDNSQEQKKGSNKLRDLKKAHLSDKLLNTCHTVFPISFLYFKKEVVASKTTYSQMLLGRFQMLYLSHFSKMSIRHIFFISFEIVIFLLILSDKTGIIKNLP